MKSLPRKTRVTEHRILKDCSQVVWRSCIQTPRVFHKFELREASLLPEATAHRPSTLTGTHISQVCLLKIWLKKAGVFFPSVSRAIVVFPRHTELPGRRCEKSRNIRSVGRGEPHLIHTSAYGELKVQRPQPCAVHLLVSHPESRVVFKLWPSSPGRGATVRTVLRTFSALGLSGDSDFRRMVSSAFLNTEDPPFGVWPRENLLHTWKGCVCPGPRQSRDKHINSNLWAPLQQLYSKWTYNRDYLPRFLGRARGPGPQWPRLCVTMLRSPVSLVSWAQATSASPGGASPR